MEAKPDKAKPQDDKNSLKTLAMPELMKKLGASADGLTQAEAVKRQAQYGPNAIKEKKRQNWTAPGCRWLNCSFTPDCASPKATRERTSKAGV